MKRQLILIILLFSLVGCGGGGEEVGGNSRQGQIVFVEIDERDQFVTEYDLATRRTRRLFTAPENAWVAGTAVSPDGSQIVMAYAPEPPAGQVQFGYTGLFVLNEGDISEELVTRNAPDEVFYNPVWSPNSDFLYYSHVIPDSQNSMVFTNQLERLNPETGDIQTVATDGIWPRLSPDGTKVTYVTINPGSLANALYIADANGENSTLLIPEDRFQVVDVPMFSPDGRWIYFSASELTQSTLTWWEVLLGIEVAAAHNIPSDWWRIAAAGGEIERLTNRDEVGLYGEFSTDGEIIIFVSTSGLYQMNADGTNLERLLEVSAAPSLSWVNK